LTRSPLALVVAATTLLAAGGAAPAVANPPQILGQTALAGVGGSCTRCTAVQLSNAGPPSSTYVVPSSGVLTKFRVYVGEHVVADEDWVQPRTFRTSSPPNATVISEGAPLYLVDTPAAGAQTFYGRMPATAGDVLGARFNIGISPDATPVHFPAASGDVVAVVHPPLDPAVGEPFAVPPPAGSPQRVNMLAVLESDADGDGSGDTSQDLCPGNGAVSEEACSGTLFGSRLQGKHTTDGASCTAGGSSTCLRVQKTIAGVSTAATVDGVVVRWRVLGAATGSYRVRVVAPAGGTSYTILRSSAPQMVTAPPSPTEAISTFATRLPIPAGGYVGLNPAPTAPRFLSSAIGSEYGQLFNAGDGMVASMSAAVDGELFYDADIEPDADHDEYGDITQDACPSDASTQGACPLPVDPTPTPVPTPTPTPTPDPSATTPVISGLSATYARFRVKRRGAVVARRAHAGTTLRLQLSEPATVAFAMQRRVACKPARKRCTRWVFVHAFKRSLAAGPSSVSYSGRYRRGAKIRRLTPGVYRMSAVATNAAGRASAAKRIRLTVRR
jgi:hypothetical protein